MDETELRINGLERLLLELIAELPAEALARVAARLREGEPLDADDQVGRAQALALLRDGGLRLDGFIQALRKAAADND